MKVILQSPWSCQCLPRGITIPDRCFLLAPSLPDTCDVEADTALLSLSVDPPQGPSGKGGVGVVSTQLQWVLRHWVAEPVVENRKVVIGKCPMVLCSGCTCVYFSEIRKHVLKQHFLPYSNVIYFTFSCRLKLKTQAKILIYIVISGSYTRLISLHTLSPPISLFPSHRCLYPASPGLCLLLLPATPG